MIQSQPPRRTQAPQADAPVSLGHASYDQQTQRRFAGETQLTPPCVDIVELVTVMDHNTIANMAIKAGREEGRF